MDEISPNARRQTICLAVIATAVVTYMIFWLRPVLLPFVVALFVVSGVTPVLEMLEKRLEVNRLVAAAITFLAGLVALVIMVISISLSVVEMAQKGAAYRGRVQELLSNAESWLPFLDSNDSRPNSRQQANNDGEVSGSAPVDASQSGSDVDESMSPTQLEVPDANAGLTDDNLEAFSDTIDAFMRDGFTRLSAEFFSLASTSVIVLIYVFFLLLGSSTVDVQRPEAFDDIDGQVRSYLLMKTIISLATGAAFGLALWIFGVPMALTFGVLAFLLNYIPNVGPLVASVLPIPFILLDPSGNIWWMIAAIAVTSGIQVVSGNVVEPKMMGDKSDLHPVAILLGLMFWGMMWGITGMFLATPVTAGIKIVLARFDSTRPIAEIMAGRWGALEELQGTASGNQGSPD